jgi:hypothetical protein
MGCWVTRKSEIMNVGGSEDYRSASMINVILADRAAPSADKRFRHRRSRSASVSNSPFFMTPHLNTDDSMNFMPGKQPGKLLRDVLVKQNLQGWA